MFRTRWGGGSIVVILGLMLVQGTSAVAQQPTGPVPAQQPGGRRLVLSVVEATRLGTLNNSQLRVSFYNHLIERTRVAEAESIFEPTAFLNSNAGVSEVVFPQIFPIPQVNPSDPPQFFQTIVTDSTTLVNLGAGIRGLWATGATYSLSVNNSFRDREAGGLINPSFQTTTTFAVTQPLLRSAWLQVNEANITQTRYSESQSRQRYRDEVLQTIVRVQQAYWNYVFAIQDLDVKRRSLDLAEKLLEINRIKVETGVFAPIEIASAQSGVANRITEVEVAENAVEETADLLRRLIFSFVDDSDWDITIVPKDAPERVAVKVPDLAACVDTARNERPDLLEARLGLRSLALGVAVADVDTLPKLDLLGSASWTGLSDDWGDSYVDSFGANGAETWNVGIEVEVPLGNRAARSRLARARLQRDQAIMNYRNLEISATEAVRRAYRDLTIARRTIASRNTAADLKREELRNEQIKLENKVSTNFEVLRVQDDLAQRESELLRSRANYRIALADLARAMGSTTENLNWTTE